MKTEETKIKEAIKAFVKKNEASNTLPEGYATWKEFLDASTVKFDGRYVFVRKWEEKKPVDGWDEKIPVGLYYFMADQIREEMEGMSAGGQSGV